MGIVEKNLPPLFEAYPQLAQSIAYQPLGNFYSPIQHLKKLGHALHHHNIYIKRDDLAGLPFGGNKVRKLEFLLGDAISRGYKGVFTQGPVGSNHVCATALYTQKCGLDCVCILCSQPNTSYVQRNLKLGYYWGAQQHFLADFENIESRTRATENLTQNYVKKTGSPLYPIVAGGSDPVGTIGFVNAAFELKKQIAMGVAPEPNYIYVAVGSCGTAAGLALGIKAAGLKSTIVPLCIEEEENPTHATKLATLAQSTAQKLKAADNSFPAFTFSCEDFPVRFDFLGKGYAKISPEAHSAIATLWQTQAIKLDSTYTGKAFAALIEDIKKGFLENKNVLFWNTFCAGAFENITQKISPKDLPKDLQIFYKLPLEEGDQGV